MKGTLEFTLPEDQDAFEDAQNGWKYKSQLDDVWQQVFRPHYNHVYSDSEINRLLNENEECRKVFDYLEKLYRSVLDEN